MKRTLLIGAVVISGALGACSQATPSSAPAPTETTSAVPSAPSPTPSQFAFGETLPQQGFIFVTTSKPTAFKPPYAEVKGRHAYVTFTVRNDSLNKYVPSDQFYASVAANGEECLFASDSNKGIANAPETPILPGRTGTWKRGFTCTAPAGSELVMSIQVLKATDDEDDLVVVGTLP